MAKLARLPDNDGAHEHGGESARRMPRLRTRYYAFLSYSHQDKDLADWLHRELEKFRVPSSLAGRLTASGVVPRRLTPIFRDQHDLSAADDLGEEIKAALAASQFLLVLCSPASANSRWTNAEIESFKRTRPEGCVLAAVASGEPFASDMPGREEEESFPPALRFKYDRRGHRTTKRAEPLAADLRGTPEERRTGFLKLVAGMLGVGLDELVQRDTTRRHRQLAWLAAASLGGMAVTSTLAVTALHARDAAREQRRQAEGLIEFMVGDLRDKLEPIGKLSVLDGVGSRVLAYYSKQDTSDLSDAALVQRSKALNLMAEVAYDRGNLDEAQQLYRQAVSGTAEAVRRAPNDAGRLYEHAQNVFWVGEIAREAGRPQESEAAYREYKRIADRMASIEPDNLKYRMEVLYANEDVGISLFNQHRFAEASTVFNGVLGQIQTLASLYPANKTYRKEVATTLAWVADAQRAQGNLRGAVAYRTRQVNWLAELLASGADSDVQERLVIAHEGLGVALTDAGQLPRAVAELQTAAEQADQLVQVEPRNASWKSTAARIRLDLAIALLSQGSRAEAEQQTVMGCSQAASLPPSFAVAALQRLRTSCAMLRARIALAAGATEQASKFAEQAISLARVEHSEDPIALRYRTALAYRLLGDARERAGNSADAIAAWNSGLSALPTGVAERPWEMSGRVDLLQRLNRNDEARPLTAKLTGWGYKSSD